ncbi:MAG: molybdopterin-dependent oxidoreductase [Gammaproteobacteria bacterium]|nr:molybdopterin-dependent oxidoreductase [Gammaproteobacteria bacterium]NIM73217.1 molybdopterin-dependent oxidoreductase [Gammaproteobacteria bacterium]NIN40053.1 molybdopterin-dependent oxidoreductase [Gammaproteobacteria bacterium]NIO26267.1 molybdopterin-dependent oxidoreductase [Gammaproteobacteria bacterium]NIO66076.1 molybdopterin-dependent oxidoreductase [Gammaproteobacteria bacterium]
MSDDHSLFSEKKVDLFEIYAEDPERADEVVFERIPHTDRRGFLKGAGLATMGALVGATIPFHRNMPAGFIPEAIASTAMEIKGKQGLTVLNDRPVNAETPAHLLDDDVTPTARHFIRNNGIPPVDMNPDGWMLTIDGLVDKPLKLSIADLKNKFEVVTRKICLECGGNGRAFFNPKAKGNQWSLGAVACAEWTGVRLADVLKAAGVKSSAVYTAHYGADTHLSGDPAKLPISRGVPIKKALDANNLITFAMNGEPIHPMNGAPLRLHVPGWPGSFSHKWFNRLQLRDVVHDGPKMTGAAYRMPPHPVAPGTKVDSKTMVFIESMPVKSLITSPQTGVNLAKGERSVTVRGHAWAGDNTVSRVDVSIDFGATWMQAKLDKAPNPYAWQRFSHTVRLPQEGYYEIWARATDDAGRAQPFALAWNPKGYLNNAMHRISVVAS